MSHEVSDEHWHIAMCIDDEHVFFSPPFDADSFDEAVARGRVLFAAYLATAEQEEGGKSLKQKPQCIGVWQCGYDLSHANERTLNELL